MNFFLYTVPCYSEMVSVIPMKCLPNKFISLFRNCVTEVFR